MSDVGYADDLVSLSSSLTGLQHNAVLMSAFALLFDHSISAPKLSGSLPRLDPAQPLINHTWTGLDYHYHPSTHHRHYHISWTYPRPGPPPDHADPGYKGLSHPSFYHPQLSTGDGHSSSCRLNQHDGQGGIYRTVHPVVISGPPGRGRPPQPRIPKSASTSPDAPQRTALHAYIRWGPWAPQPLRPSQPQEMVTGKGGGLPGSAVQGLLHALVVSRGSFLHQHKGDFIGPFTPVWGSSLGALGPDTALRLSLTLGPVSHPLLRPLNLGLDRLDDFKLLHTLRRLNLSTWADLTSRSPDGTRKWLDLASLLPDVVLPHSLPPHHLGRVIWMPPGPDSSCDSPMVSTSGPVGASSRSLAPIRRAMQSPPNAGLHYPAAGIRAGYPTTIKHMDFVSRVTHRLLVSIAKDSGKGTIHAEFPDHVGTHTLPTPSWPDFLRSLLPRGHSWSVYTDASWQAKQPLQAQAVFGTQGTHEGREALFLTADFPGLVFTHRRRPLRDPPDPAGPRRYGTGGRTACNLHRAISSVHLELVPSGHDLFGLSRGREKDHATVDPRQSLPGRRCCPGRGSSSPPRSLFTGRWPP